MPFKTLLLLQTLFFSFLIHAQPFNVRSSEEIKMKISDRKTEIIYADKDFVYIRESGTKGTSAFESSFVTKLHKFDRNFKPVFEKDYFTELSGLMPHSIQVLNNELYLFALSYNSNMRQMRVMAVKLDKVNGKFMGPLKEVSKSNFNTFFTPPVQIKPQPGRNFFTVVTENRVKEIITYEVSLFSPDLSVIQATKIPTDFNHTKFTLEEVVITATNNIAILGYNESQRAITYTMRIYGPAGDELHNVDLKFLDHNLCSGKFTTDKRNQIFFAGLYTDKKDEERLRGFTIGKLDEKEGKIIAPSFHTIDLTKMNVSSVATEESFEEGEDSDDKEKKTNKKPKLSFSPIGITLYDIRSFFINPSDSSFILCAETYDLAHGSNEYGSSRRFRNRDILIVKTKRDLSLAWTKGISKYQQEYYNIPRVIFDHLTPIHMGSSYFAVRTAPPVYGSYYTYHNKDKLMLLLNDHEDNTTNVEPGQKFRELSVYTRACSTYAIVVDLANGNHSRHVLYSENKMPSVAMPRHAYSMENEIIIPSWKIPYTHKSELKYLTVQMR